MFLLFFSLTSGRVLACTAGTPSVGNLSFAGTFQVLKKKKQQQKPPSLLLIHSQMQA
jgi:hypothetical protein